LTKVLSELKPSQAKNYEIVYVDNGSTDQTLQVLQDIFKNDKHVSIIELRRNFGYQGSISAGLSAAGGDAVITIDADLQDDPTKIPDMLDLYSQGYELVLGVRRNRKTDPFLKRFFSEQYYRLLKSLGVEVVHNHGDFRLMSRALVDEFNQMDERNRFIRAMIFKLDDRFATVEYDRAPRLGGESKFDVPALFSLSFDGIISFSYAPLRLATLAGALMCALSVAGTVWAIYMKLSAHSFPAWSNGLFFVAFGGFQLLLLGIIGEYIGRLYIEVKHRPLFSVRKKHHH
jgi:glycosyltransferase involved in cell wall biosynthesis